MNKIVIPKVDANIEEGSVGAWMVAPGDRVRKGQPLVEYITDKAVFEIEAPASGVLRRITAPEKSVVPIGSIIGFIGRADEPLPDREDTGREPPPADASAPRNFKTDTGRDSPAPAVASSRTRSSRPRATMGARRLARRHGVSLETVREHVGDTLITEAMVTRFINR